MARTKVAVLIGTLERGGAELDIVRNFPRLNRDEFEVVVICFQTPGVLAAQIEQAGVRVISRNVKRPEKSGLAVVRYARDVLYALGLVLWIGRTLNAEKVDIAHFFLPYSYAYGMLACLLMRPQAKRVMSRLSLNFYSGEYRLLSWLERHWFHRKLDAAIANSRPIIEELASEGVPRDRIHLLYNGIDLDAFTCCEDDRQEARDSLGIESEAFVIVAVGNLHSYKGHADLVTACARSSPHLPEGWRLLIAGRDEDGNKAVLTQLAEELGVEEQVRLLGEFDDVSTLLAAADLFAQPSHHEGLPNAVLEAMAASLPVMATNVGGLPEVVVIEGSDRTGWLVDPQDVEGLAAVVAQAGQDAARCRLFGERARAQIEQNFSIAQSVSHYESIYREIRQAPVAE